MFKRTPLLLILIGLFIATLLYFAISRQPEAPAQAEKPALPAPEKTAPKPAWTPIPIHKGDTLSGKLSAFHIDYPIIQQLLKMPEAKDNLLTIKPGDELSIYLAPDPQHFSLAYAITPTENIIFHYDGTQWTAESKQIPLRIQLRYEAGTVGNNFTQSAQHSGLSLAQAYALSHIFSGYLDFSKDIQPSDHWELLYENYFLNDKLIKTGYIVAAKWFHGDKAYTAIRFTYPNEHTNYYTPDGKGLTPLFLKWPIHFKRISSYFSLHRYDPVIHRIHPHLGVDLAAPTGTPIHAIGSGRVLFIGKRGGYGNAILIRHNRQYQSLYAHLSRFQRKLHRGSVVKKGQVIGYVGQTGWATGPHLHFEMHVFGIPHDPLSLKFIGGNPVPAAYLEEFKKQAASLESLLAQKQSENNDTTTDPDED